MRVPSTSSGWLTLIVRVSSAAPGSRVNRTVASKSAGEPRWAPASTNSMSNSSSCSENGGRSSCVEQRTTSQPVVLDDGVGKARTLRHDHGRPVPEKAADGDRHQHDDHRDVEDQVAGLAQLARFRCHRRVDALIAARPFFVGWRPGGDQHAEPTRLQLVAGGGEHVRRRCVDFEATVGRHPRQPTGSRRWVGSRGAPVLERPGHDAADQRDDQRQVDRREPRRRVHIEQAEPVVPLPQPGLRSRKSATASGLISRCGTTEPGIAATASRNNRISATRIEVSCRHAHAANSTGESAGGRPARWPEWSAPRAPSHCHLETTDPALK